ncbi:transposable element Tc1 transposase [Trichonephila clavipes]|uniref:Transposable element Tc1 transposase n=1 Tax=Trichonephila clavipes TaxID=2585209 RepID=A0A8X6UY77_TRICX|nr:transposable element Tc1 transposase [Trichonephila clavipes]
MCQIEAHEIRLGRGLDCLPVVSRSFEHHVDDSTIWLDSTPIWGDNTLRAVRGLPPLIAFHQPHERTSARRLFRVAPRHTCLLRDSNAALVAFIEEVPNIDAMIRSVATAQSCGTGQRTEAQIGRNGVREPLNSRPGVIGPYFVFMNDNARPHRIADIQHLLESEDIVRRDWSAFTSNLNPIEHAWDALGRRFAARLPLRLTPNN